MDVKCRRVFVSQLGETTVVATTMRAARFYGPGQPLRLEPAPMPRPATGEALVRVRVAGVCHTELQMLDGVLNLGVSPLTPGHEVVGDVLETRGASPVSSGQRVLLSYEAPCGICAYCRSGAENLCPDATRQIGFTADGGYADYLVAPVRALVPLPDTLEDDAAVGLACGGATALHAARAVAGVRLGETVAVYGVGGVGFYLVQVCRLAGATVIAIGRTPEKLDRAVGLGADHVVNAANDDALAAVLDLTAGRGADVVFDLVASAETLSIAPRMLARRGRLILPGYSADRLCLPPLWLVLRELQIRGAVGNTLAELEETVALAASGKLQSVVGKHYPLEGAQQALDDLRAGRVIGRAVLDIGVTGNSTGRTSQAATSDLPALRSNPTSVAQRPSPFDQVVGSFHRGADQDGGQLGAPIPEPIITSATAAPSVPLPPAPTATLAASTTFHRNSRTVDGQLPHLPRPGPRPFEAELIELIGRGVDVPTDDDEFNALALGLFAFQYGHNVPYRQYCDYRRRKPDCVRHWTEIPAVPIGAFKEAVLATEPVETAAALFTSSGTTRPDQRSRQYHPDLAVYDASARVNFAAHVLPGSAVLPMLVLHPPPTELPNSSLAHYLGLMLDRYGAPGSGYFVGADGLHVDDLYSVLHAATDAGQPVALLGTTFAYVHLLDHMLADGRTISLPAGSRLFDTGGVKGRSREIGRDELTRVVEERLRVPAPFQINMYGLTELSTQFLDTVLRDHLRDAGLPRHKVAPPWARTRLLDPQTLDPVPDGTEGVLCHTDLANRASVCTVLTEDIGIAREGGFEILGRMHGTQARGCSIAMDDLLTAIGHRA